MAIYVIGGANIDLFAKSYNPLIKNDSNPAKMELGFGGVGRNIAENLAHLSEEVEFISIFSKDYFGEILVRDCEEKGLKLNYSIFKDDLKSSMYLAILDHENDLYLGLSDMRIIESLNKDDIKELKEVIKADDYLIIDTNISLEMLDYITSEFKGIKVSDAISVNKVYKLKNHLNDIDIIKVNLIEAQALADMELKDQSSIKKALLSFDEKGAKDVIITTKEGAYLLRDHKTYYYVHNNYQKDLKNATGAGDSFLAAYIHARKANMSVDDCLGYGLATAILTISSDKTVADIDLDKVLTKKNELNIEGGEI